MDSNCLQIGRYANVGHFVFNKKSSESIYICKSPPKRRRDTPVSFDKCTASMCMLVCIQMHRLGLESHQGASTLPKQYTILYSKRDTSNQDVSTDVLGGLGRYKHVTQV